MSDKSSPIDLNAFEKLRPLNQHIREVEQESSTQTQRTSPVRHSLHPSSSVPLSSLPRFPAAMQSNAHNSIPSPSAQQPICPPTPSHAHNPATSSQPVVPPMHSNARNPAHRSTAQPPVDPPMSSHARGPLHSSPAQQNVFATKLSHSKNPAPSSSRQQPIAASPDIPASKFSETP